MADVLTDGETALLFEPGDVAGCGWALERATRLDPAPLGAACRALAEAELDGRVETGRYLEALAEASAAPAVVRPLRAADAP